MKKIALILSSVAVMSMIFAGCQAATSENTDSENTATSENVENTETTNNDNNSIKTIKATLGEPVTIGDFEFTLTNINFGNVLNVEYGSDGSFLVHNENIDFNEIENDVNNRKAHEYDYYYDYNNSYIDGKKEIAKKDRIYCSLEYDVKFNGKESNGLWVGENFDYNDGYIFDVYKDGVKNPLGWDGVQFNPLDKPKIGRAYVNLPLEVKENTKNPLKLVFSFTENLGLDSKTIVEYKIR